MSLLGWASLHVSHVWRISSGDHRGLSAMRVMEGESGSCVQSVGSERVVDQTQGRRKRAKRTNARRTKSTCHSAVEGSGLRQRRLSLSPIHGPTQGDNCNRNSGKRTPLYVVQKQERVALIDQVRELEAQLELLKIKVGLPTVQDANTLAHIQQKNFELEEEIHVNLLKMGRLQAMLTTEVHGMPVNPMKTSIHLPREMNKRKAILQDMKGVKLRRAQEIVSNYLQGFDPLSPYRNEHHYRTKDGLHRLMVLSIHQFEGVRSIRQVFDALMYCNANLEMTVTELLGQLTIREDGEEIDSTIWNHRIATAGHVGDIEELNTVGFAHFYDNYIPHKGAQFAVVTTDTVDIDELYPYKPMERTRKDGQSAQTISEYRKPDTGELVVVLRTCRFSAQIPPAFPAPPILMENLLKNMTRWDAVYKQAMRDYLAGNQTH